MNKKNRSKKAPTAEIKQTKSIETKHSQVDADRREFLKQGAIGLAALSLGGCATGGTQGRNPASDGHVSVGNGDQFEFIIVGSGAGGGPLAARLALAGHSVLLLEAGDINNGNNTRVPALHARATEDPEISWNFYVKHYADEKRGRLDSKYVPGKGILYPRAATVGGCTAHNALITMYPDNEDFDSIAKLTGDASWEGSEMRKHFQRLERNHYSSPGWFNTARNGFKGWLDTSRTDIGFALHDRDVRAIVESTVGEQNIFSDVVQRFVAEGLNVPPDPNRWQYVINKTSGVFSVPMSAYEGVRSGPREFILDTMKKTNKLNLKTNAFCKRILFSPTEPDRAVGVEFYDSASVYSADPRANVTRSQAAPLKQVFASREVILAGGAFNTPQLLMLSGIGDPEELRRAGVQGPYIALPGVGKNLQDRYEIGVISEMTHDLNLTKNCTLGDPDDPCLKDYDIDHSKSIYSTNGVVISLLRKSSRNQGSPDLCIFGLPGHFNGYYPNWSKEALNPRQFSWAVLKGHTHNTGGRVKLKSANPFDTPDINFSYFDEGNGDWKEDLAGVVEGVRAARRMNQTLTGRGVLRTELVPGEKGVDKNGALSEFILREAWGHHASCSNKMGVSPDGREQAVVDSSFRVHKTKNLRIVDASVFPKIPGLFPALPIYMIAEKASQVILADIRG